jgi:3-deoxy-7-phosphoheptulonate synthase
MDYARQLKVQADALQDDLLIVMRVYFEKPRTTVGWKGYINDPYRDGSFAVNEGLELARRLLLDVLALGLPAGTNSGSAVAAVHQRPGQLGRDWCAHHREPEPSPAGQRPELPRGLQERHRRRREGGQRCHFGRPVQHAFMGMTKMGQSAIFETRGNQDCHIILRGGKAPTTTRPMCRPRAKCWKKRPAPAGDDRLSHANSSKQHRRQIDVSADVAQQIAGAMHASPA